MPADAVSGSTACGKTPHQIRIAERLLSVAELYSQRSQSVSGNSPRVRIVQVRFDLTQDPGETVYIGRVRQNDPSSWPLGGALLRLFPTLTTTIPGLGFPV